MTDIGYLALLLALIVAIYSVLASVVGARKGHHELTVSARNGLLMVFGLYSLGIVAMLYALLSNDFSIELVAGHSSRDLGIPYKIAALYADKGGSLMFWGWLISLFTTVLVVEKRGSFTRVMPYAIGILAAMQAFFLGLITLVVNVFESSSVSRPDGADLNPLLQNPGMLFHPPLLFGGFAAFALVFAFAVGSLVRGGMGNSWIPGIRRWALFAWCMLGLGNLVGAWWAYVELGWGGYWVWDPVENASLMPWLVGTAFVHSIAMQRKRGYLKKWSMALIVITFSLTLMSPFITHGGITSELHGFGGTPFVEYLGIAILVVLVVSTILLLRRRDELEDETAPSSLVSREGAFLATNIVLAAAAGLTLLITCWPRLVEELGRTASIGRGTFDWVVGPTLLLVVFLMGVCPLLGWRRSSVLSAKRNFGFSLAAVFVAAVIILILGIGNWYAVAAIVCGFPLLSILQEWFKGARARHRMKGENVIEAFFTLIWRNRPRYGGFVVHIGVILITLGVIGSSLYDEEREATLSVGESVEIKGYALTHTGLEYEDRRTFDPNTGRPSGKEVISADIEVRKGNSRIGTMSPELNYWPRQDNSFAEAAIRTTPLEDLFISLRAYDFDSGTATLRVLVNPLVLWMWIGGGVLLLGGVVAFWPGRPAIGQADMSRNVSHPGEVRT